MNRFASIVDSIVAWQKNKSVERTSPGSKNRYKVTYWDGKEKWTDDRPGDGRGGRREQRLHEKKQTRPSIKDAKAKLSAGYKAYVSGKSDEAALRQVVDDVIVKVGREVAREVISDFLRTMGDLDGRAKEGVKIIRDRKVERLRKKESKMNRIAQIAERMMTAERFGFLYDHLNDAASETGNPGYEIGRTDIWYMKPSFFRDGIGGYDFLSEQGLLPDPKNLSKTHVFVGRINESDLNQVYRMMQGDKWSPHGQARTMLQRKGLQHTSMSIGDVIIVAGGTFIVDRTGFKKL